MPEPQKLFPDSKLPDPTLTISERETDEIILIFVGPVGSGVSTTSTIFAKHLKDKFKYSVDKIRVSDLIMKEIEKNEPNKKYSSEKERVEHLQKEGTRLREIYGERYLAEKCIDHMARHRRKGKLDEEENDIINDITEPRRHAYIIDSFKHPEEIELLKEVYGELVWVFGIFAPENIRESRLINKGVPKKDIDILFDVDENESVEHGQKVRDSIQLSDFFIRNDADNEDKLESSVLRYLDIIFGTKLTTPTIDETGMYNAAAAAAGSACLSRQVGAAIYSVANELIGKGRNDVPKAHGGLYRHEDDAEDHRCFKWKDKKCHNDDRKENLYKEIIKALQNNDLMTKDLDLDQVRLALRSTDVKNLIEFSRAVHAEMDAIISVARGSKSGIVGGTIYVTTFPCHSCARHIVASGISRTVYIEPYPKSLALTLHSDAISSDSADKHKVAFVQYEGVAPRNMLRLFEYRQARKKDGRATTIDPAIASPISRSPLDGFRLLELLVVKKVAKYEEKSN